jgi:signal transduction histidine kinase
VNEGAERSVNGGHPGELSLLLAAKRDELIERWRIQIESTIADSLTYAELLDGMPQFIDELIVALSPEPEPVAPEAVEVAEEHGAQRLRIGFDIGEVVREYGLLHRCILEVATGSALQVNVPEHIAIVRALNLGIVGAVTRYERDRDREQRRLSSEHLAFVAHEVRNPLATARLALDRLRDEVNERGQQAFAALDRSMKRTAAVVDSALINTTFEMGLSAQVSTLRVRELLEEVLLDASAEAQAKNIRLVPSVEGGLQVPADPRLLRSALSNLIRNAVKFSRRGTAVHIRASRRENLVTIEVEDACGGLPAGKLDELFAPLVQKGEDRSGFGLGLAIARQAARAHGGNIRAADHPGEGCVFALELPAG